jgi:hypothetical protein
VQLVGTGDGAREGALDGLLSGDEVDESLGRLHAE